jgi:hypothetical protein
MHTDYVEAFQDILARHMVSGVPPPSCAHPHLYVRVPVVSFTVCCGCKITQRMHG